MPMAQHRNWRTAPESFTADCAVCHLKEGSRKVHGVIIKVTSGDHTTSEVRFELIRWTIFGLEEYFCTLRQIRISLRLDRNWNANCASETPYDLQWPRRSDLTSSTHLFVGPRNIIVIHNELSIWLRLASSDCFYFGFGWPQWPLMSTAPIPRHGPGQFTFVHQFSAPMGHPLGIWNTGLQ